MITLTDQKFEEQAKTITEISTKYERDKNYWHMAINDLEMKVKVLPKCIMEIQR